MALPPPIGRDIHRRPHPPAARLVVLGVLLLTVTLIEVQAIGFAFRLAGLNPVAASAVLLASLAGSVVNVPVARLRTGRTYAGYGRVQAYGLVYLVPLVTSGRTVLAVNLGGAVIPAAVSVYLVVATGLWFDSLVAVAAVAFVVHLTARPVRELGIVLSPLVPALTAALLAIALHPTAGTAAVAYVAGTMGTLIGADLTHLPTIRRMQAPVASIGGGGTFDAVFVAGIIAVLLAAFL